MSVNGPRLTLLRTLSKSGGSTVYHALNIPPESRKEFVHLAVKAVPNSQAAMLLTEADLLKACSGDLFPAFIDSVTVNEEHWMIMEYCSQGSLVDLMQKRKSPYSEREIAIVLHRVAKALKFLHSKGIVHRDVKGANILVDSSGKVKLADLGVACLKTVVSKVSPAGSPHWMAPESFDITTWRSHSSEKVDIWSLGITAIELALGEPPNSYLSPRELAHKYYAKVDAVLFPLFKEWSPLFANFVKRCLQVDPSMRPSAEDVLEDPFLRDVSEFDLLASCESITDIIKQRKEPIFRKLRPRDSEENEQFDSRAARHVRSASDKVLSRHNSASKELSNLESEKDKSPAIPLNSPPMYSRRRLSSTFSGGLFERLLPSVAEESESALDGVPKSWSGSFSRTLSELVLFCKDEDRPLHSLRNARIEECKRSLSPTVNRRRASLVALQVNAQTARAGMHQIKLVKSPAISLESGYDLKEEDELFDLCKRPSMCPELNVEMMDSQDACFLPAFAALQNGKKMETLKKSITKHVQSILSDISDACKSRVISSEEIRSALDDEIFALLSASQERLIKSTVTRLQKL